MTVVLAIDFGLKNLGLAIYRGFLVEPFGRIKLKTNRWKLLIEKLINISIANKVDLIVIGLPKGKLEPLIKKLAFLLEEKSAVKVVFQDESFTSKEAVFKMLETGKPKMKRRKQEHQVAACLILERYLEQTGLDRKEEY